MPSSGASSGRMDGITAGIGTVSMGAGASVHGGAQVGVGTAVDASTTTSHGRTAEGLEALFRHSLDVYVASYLNAPVRCSDAQRQAHMGHVGATTMTHEVTHMAIR